MVAAFCSFLRRPLRFDSMRPLWIFPVIIFLFCTSAVAQSCYFPNGVEASADTACNPNALVSQCCFDNQACLSNGLCVSNPHDEEKKRLHRGTCTDKDWKSGNCPRHCLDIDNNGVPVFSCNQTDTDSYCCYDNCECTSEFDTFSSDDIDVFTMTIIGESFTQTHSSTPVSLGTAAASQTPESSLLTPTTSASKLPMPAADPDETENDSSSSNSTAIGVGVGVGLGGAAVLAAIGFFFWRRRKRSTNNAVEMDTDGSYYGPGTTKYACYYEKEGSAHIATAVSASSPRSELPTNENPIELPTGSPPPTGATSPKR